MVRSLQIPPQPNCLFLLLYNYLSKISVMEFSEINPPSEENNQLGLQEDALSVLAGLDRISTEEGQWLTESMIARRLGLDEMALFEVSMALDLDLKYIGVGNRKRAAFSGIAIQKINAEIDYQNLPQEVGTTQISISINRHRATTTGLIRDLGLEPSLYVEAFGRKDAKYDKSVIRELRKYIESQSPPAEDWLNLHQLTLMSGEDRGWIERRLAEAGIESEARRSGITGHSLTHYPAKCLEVLKQATEDRPAQGDDWLTAQAIEKIVGKSSNWIRLRLEEYRGLAEPRLDEQGVPRLHYPADALTGLIDEADTIEATLESEGYLSIPQMSEALGKSPSWVENRMEPFSELGESRRDKRGRLHAKYPEEVLDQLATELEYIMSYPEAEDFLTISGLARAIGRSGGWVKKQIDGLGVNGDTRRDGAGRLREHYHPDISQILVNSD